MGGKKKGKGGKGKKGKGGGEFGLSVEEETEMLYAQQESLINRLITETDDANKMKAREGEKRLREMQLERMLKKEEQA